MQAVLTPQDARFPGRERPVSRPRDQAVLEITC